MGVGARVGQHTRLRSDTDRTLALDALGETAQRVAPLTLAAARRLDVLPALAAVLPEGLQRGSTVAVSGVGSLTLAMALMAGAMRGDAWAATVGCNDLCLAAAEGVGVPMHRLVVVTRPGRGLWGTVVAALLDSFEVVVVAPTARVSLGDARRLRSRARERGSVIIDLAGTWPEAHDLSLRVTEAQWYGLGQGHGVLEARHVTIEVAGRRGATRPRVVPLWLPGPDGAPAPIEPDHAGADIDALVEAAPDFLRTAG
jgi:hypothetical protein